MRLLDFRVDGKLIRDEGFESDATAGFLWCAPCGKQCTTKTDRIRDHIRSASHKAAMERAKRRNVRLQYINHALAAAAANNQVATGAHADSGGVKEKVVHYRVDVLRGWMQARWALA
jgi:DnaJ-domain-containing protein 1